MDIRRLQRTLFRMQADPAFAAQLFADDEAAWNSTGLKEAERELLGGLDPAGVEADPGGRRRTQVTGNAASEYAATLAAASFVGVHDWLEGFPASPEFHRAIAEDDRLPFAFGDYSLRRATQTGCRELHAVASLEIELANLRRTKLATDPPLVAGDLRLSLNAHLLELPQGTHSWVEGLREAIATDTAAPAPTDFDEQRHETVLAFVRPAPSAHALHSVVVERLEPPTDSLLARTRHPFPAEARAQFAREAGSEPSDLEAFLEGWVEDGVLRRG